MRIIIFPVRKNIEKNTHTHTHTKLPLISPLKDNYCLKFQFPSKSFLTLNFPQLKKLLMVFIYFINIVIGH